MYVYMDFKPQRCTQFRSSVHNPLEWIAAILCTVVVSQTKSNVLFWRSIHGLQFCGGGEG